MTNHEKVLKMKPKRWIMNTVFAVAIFAALIYSFSGSSINLIRLTTFKYALQDIADGFANINGEFLFGYGAYTFTEGIIYLAGQTLAIAFIGTLIGAVLAIPFGFLASSTIVGKHVSKVGIALITAIRVFPEIVLALVLIKGFGMTPFACLLAIGIHSIGMLGKMFSEAIDNMDTSPIEALDAVGANVWQKIRFGILPQIVPDLSSITLYRLDINVRSASVLGIVGTSAGGFGAVLVLASQPPQWDTLATILVAVIVLVLIMDTISSALRKKLV